MDAPSTRRTVVRQFIIGTVASWMGGLWRCDTLLATEAAGIKDNATLSVKLSQFPALAFAGGSVRLNVGLGHPVAINRGPANAFYAVNTCCAHLGCTVNAFDAGLNKMRCGCHGSLYNIDGSLAGGPATRGLDRYTAVFDGADTVMVSLPSATYGARDIVVQNTTPTGRRIKLTFHPAIFTTYEVQYRASLTDAPQVIGFSTTPTGAATQISYRNTDFDPDAPSPLVPLYVDVTGPHGFFSIALVVSEY